MRISLLLLAMLCVCLPLVAVDAQQADAANSLQGDNGKDGDLDAKNDDLAAAGEDDKDKPRKKTFTEERFEKLFNNRYRSKPRLLTPKYHDKPKPKLPSFIKKPPVVKPLGQDGLPVDDAPRQTRTTPQTNARSANARSNSRTSTTTPSPRSSRGRTSTSTTTQRPSSSDRRFNLSQRGRGTDTSSSNPAISRGRGRIN